MAAEGYTQHSVLNLQMSYLPNLSPDHVHKRAIILNVFLLLESKCLFISVVFLYFCFRHVCLLKLCSAEREGSKIKHEETANGVFVFKVSLLSWEVLGIFSKWKKNPHIILVFHTITSRRPNVDFLGGSDTILTAAQKVASNCRSCPQGGGIFHPFPDSHKITELE